MNKGQSLDGYGNDGNVIKRTVPGVNHERVKKSVAPELYTRLLDVTLDDAYDNMWAPEFYTDPGELESETPAFIDYDARKLNYSACDIQFSAEQCRITPLEMLCYVEECHNLNTNLHPHDKNATDIVIGKIRKIYQDDIKRAKQDYVK